MSSKLSFSVLLITLLLAPAGLRAEDCEHSEPREARLDARGATAVEVVSEAGWLRVEGREDLEEARVRGTACASRPEYLDQIELRTERRDETLRIVARTPDDLSGWRKYARLEMTVEVPAGLAVSVRDSSGSIEVRDVASVDIDDSSGSIEVEDVAGEVRVRDGSGSVDIWRAGSVLITEDGSGSTTVRDVGRDVEIQDDGSGGIRIEDVGGSVTIGDDGSGSIDVARVEGDLVVASDGSGGISYDDIGGRIDVP